MAKRMGLMGGILAVLTGSALVLSACGGVSQDEFNKAKNDLAAKERELTTAKAQLATREQEVSSLQKQVQDAAKGGSVAWTVIPNAPPRPTPTPRPPGFTPPPPPSVPASYTAPMPIFFYVDTVTAGPGESKYNVDASRSCVISGVFKRGQHIVWRVEAIDGTTGKRLVTADVDKANLKLPNGETIAMRFSRHGALDTSPWFWTAAWDVPPDHPLGVLDFSVEFTTKDSKAGTFKQLAVSAPERGIESRLQIID